MEARIARILRSSMIDGPGHRAVVFFQRCNFNCAYCHNPETIGADNPEARSMSLAQVLDEIRPYRALYRGVTLSGGECGLQADFALALARGFKDMGLPLIMDTNGSIDYSALPALVDAVQGFILDVKAFSPTAHKRLTGADNGMVLSNLGYLAGIGKIIEIRHVVLPGWTDDVQTSSCIGEYLSRCWPVGRAQPPYRIMAFNRAGVRLPFSDIAPPTLESLEQAAHAARFAGAVDVRIG